MALKSVQETSFRHIWGRKTFTIGDFPVRIQLSIYSSCPIHHVFCAWVVCGVALTRLHAPPFIQSKVRPKPMSFSHMFPRFASASCYYFELWLAHCIVRALCPCLEGYLWFWFWDIPLKTALDICSDNRFFYLLSLETFDSKRFL